MSLTQQVHSRPGPAASQAWLSTECAPTQTSRTPISSPETIRPPARPHPEPGAQVRPEPKAGVGTFNHLQRTKPTTSTKCSHQPTHGSDMEANTLG